MESPLPRALKKLHFSGIGKGPGRHNSVKLNNDTLAVSGNTDDGAGTEDLVGDPFAYQVALFWSIRGPILCFLDGSQGFLFQIWIQRRHIVHILLLCVE